MAMAMAATQRQLPLLPRCKRGGRSARVSLADFAARRFVDAVLLVFATSDDEKKGGFESMTAGDEEHRATTGDDDGKEGDEEKKADLGANNGGGDCSGVTRRHRCCRCLYGIETLDGRCSTIGRQGYGDDNEGGCPGGRRRRRRRKHGKGGDNKI